MIGATTGAQILETSRRTMGVDVLGYNRRADLTRSDLAFSGTATGFQVGYGSAINVVSYPSNTRLNVFCRKTAVGGVPCVETFEKGYFLRLGITEIADSVPRTMIVQCRLAQMPPEDGLLQIASMSAGYQYDRGAYFRIRGDGGFTLYSRRQYGTPKWNEWVHGPAGSVHAGRWVHLGVAWDCTDATLYVDGVPVASGPIRMYPSMNQMNIACAVGRQAVPEEQPLGCWGDWRMYRRCLSPDEMARIYYSTKRS